MGSDSTSFASKTVRRAAAYLFRAILIWCVGACGLPKSPADRTKEIGNLMSTLYERGQFNGAVLVAQQGDVIYRKALGKANLQTATNFTPETPSDIGSLTKQFTAMAIMILAEQSKVSYDDPVSKYIPEFSRSLRVSKISVRHLLTHTSGIPDYGDLGIDDSRLTPQGLIAIMLGKEGLFSQPGLKYRYSNPGYSLLAIVVERVSGRAFGDFLEQEIFKPAGMRNTFVYDSPRKGSTRAAIGYDQFGQVDDSGPTAIPGDGGIYSTVDDLFQWDQALYTDKLVRQSTMSLAFTPGKVEEGNSNYGFGWNVGEDGNDKYVWHTGSHAGFRAFIERRLTKRVTVIMLTNKGNSKRLDINVAVQSILADKPYVLPKQSGAEKLYRTIHESGIQAAMRMFDSLKNKKDANYDLGESELNTLGYQLLYRDKRPSDAIAILKLNSTEHPKSSNAFDSLGEAYRNNGDKDLAINSYQTAVILDPTNGHAAEMLKELK
jgi:CubicO group peptidase (beta-lactamase class C family)